ncbi:DUF4011 domain-containing protein [Sphingobacterium sp. UDSM-2020]|uniref:DUF4011 domain-containing protein n=1 Tax=Sphingobacterium sp. UDSM-2020 TaxID=2795738 RepID=UPI0019357DE0|nr:DUF4011 domain-containing protein [Sphingobacterium sp. UDSM-2020]QQD13787.1 DUF4011 domain-containing protein [Sphingobacterium sp. UDSM-2020]
MDNMRQVYIERDVAEFLNLSMYQNQITFLSNLMLSSKSDQILEKIRIEIDTEGAWMEPFSYELAYLPVGLSVKIPTDKIIVKPIYFLQLSEVERSTFQIRVYQDENLLTKEVISIALQPLSFFGGFNTLPELLASYITPNHPYIYAVKSKAIAYLEQQNLPVKFEGYQATDPSRILEMMRAIYHALQAQEIVYSALPPSFEENGQRLRMVDVIAKKRFGNCIDISLLYAACLEAIDLNPIIIVTKGHAFVGCWLHQDRFAQIINEDKTAITKRFAKGISEIVVVESTSVCKGASINFNQAIDLAEASLIERNDFFLSIDIKRARASGIKPLPLKIDDSFDLEHEFIRNQVDLKMQEETIEVGKIYKEFDGNDNKSISKQKVWERKLLDLSLRNNLLNLRMTKNMLQIMDVNIHDLEDLLVDGKSFSISASADAPILKQYNILNPSLHPSSPAYQLAKEELAHNRLLSYYHADDLDTILTHISRNAKLSIEENGSSTLFLAIGLLQWRDKKTLAQVRSAPIILIPVELTRRSINSKFVLKSREEEAMINITLLEFLRQEHGLDLRDLEELPKDGKGIDVAQLIAQMRRAIMGLKGWDIVDQVILGNFSFNKLILWNDIAHQSEEIAKSSIVRSLIDGQLRLDIGKEEVPLDFDNINPSALALPIATDVSQLEAIFTSNQNQSFVLHGPPGTGKSQTITNIIANALYQGKKVLFVAAKKAALDVVYKRLAAIGLSNFCLELHSNKAKKSDVLSQLAETLEQPQLKGNFNFQDEANHLINAKKELQIYISQLHKQQPIGWSLYDSITALTTLESYQFAKIDLSQTFFDSLTNEKWRTWKDLVIDLNSVSKIIANPSQNPFKGIALVQYSSAIQQEVVSSAVELNHTLLEYGQLLRQFISNFDMPIQNLSWSDLYLFDQLIKSLTELPETDLSLWKMLLSKSQEERLQKWISDFEIYQIRRQVLLNHAHKSVLDANLTALESLWSEAKQTWFLPKWFKKRKVKKGLSAFSTIPLHEDETFDQFFAYVNAFQQIRTVVESKEYEAIHQGLGSSYLQEDTNLKLVQEQIETLKIINGQLLALSNVTVTDIVQKWIEKSKTKTTQLIPNQEYTLHSLTKVWGKLLIKSNDFQTLTQLDIRSYPVQVDWLTEIEGKMSGIIDQIDYLKNWTNYSKTKEKAISLDLNWFIELYEKDDLKQEHLLEHFDYIIHYNLANKVIASHEALNMFNVRLFEDKIEKYKQIANSFTELTKKELLLRLNERLPNNTIEALQGSEIAILQRAIKNRGRGVSIRKLFDQIPALLPRLAPCMLMSPISVAQYFEVNPDQFDLLIFDEASQLPTCEAVSSLARSKHAVIVGDPKQMPPTSFFMTNKVDEENMEIEDLESILDDCLSLSFPSKYLLRHYRSKHESLIAFSNSHYYDNKLLTFPSADDLNSRVTYQHVSGHYDKGKTRQNKFEAQAIVEDVARRFQNAKTRKQSVGIVTFSQVQQNLIEDKLNELYRLDSELEAWATESDEPIFIKNLENVQGDERDVILFSIGYGPDENGQVSMNFGPLNREGGWRRLNVAVTRAREEMKVFATLRSDQINLNRTASEGVAGLKNFLTFAEKGHLVLDASQITTTDNHANLTQNIANRLRAEGLIVNVNIGTSDYRVDLGIVHPEHPKRYILSILLDGLNYFQAETTNDRELVLPKMLESLGWNIFRIWTLDWIENADLIVESILEKVNALLLKTEEHDHILANVTESIHQNGYHIEEIDYSPIISKQIPYESTHLPKAFAIGAEGLEDLGNRALIHRQMELLIHHESPISKSFLYKRIMEHWEAKPSVKIERILSEIIVDVPSHVTKHRQPFYWKEQSVVDINYYRSNAGIGRNSEDIAPEEIIVALQEAVEQNLSIVEDDLVRYLARQFDFQKMGKQIEFSMRYAIGIAIEKQLVTQEEGRIKMIDNK